MNDLCLPLPLTLEHHHPEPDLRMTFSASPEHNIFKMPQSTIDQYIYRKYLWYLNIEIDQINKEFNMNMLKKQKNYYYLSNNLSVHIHNCERLFAIHSQYAIPLTSYSYLTCYFSLHHFMTPLHFERWLQTTASISIPTSKS